MSEGNSGNRYENHEISVKTPLGTLHAEVVDAQGDYPGISVMLERPDGFRGFVSLTEVCADGLTCGIPARLQTNCYDGLHEDPIAIDCDPDGPWMFEYGQQSNDGELLTDHPLAETLIVLEACGENVLLFNPSDHNIPFIVADGYDAQSGKWSHARYFRDVMSASCHLNEADHSSRTVPGLEMGASAPAPFQSGLDALLDGMRAEVGAMGGCSDLIMAEGRDSI